MNKEFLMLGMTESLTKTAEIDWASIANSIGSNPLYSTLGGAALGGVGGYLMGDEKTKGRNALLGALGGGAGGFGLSQFANSDMLKNYLNGDVNAPPPAGNYPLTDAMKGSTGVLRPAVQDAVNQQKLVDAPADPNKQVMRQIAPNMGLDYVAPEAGTGVVAPKTQMPDTAKPSSVPGAEGDADMEARLANIDAGGLNAIMPQPGHTDVSPAASKFPTAGREPLFLQSLPQRSAAPNAAVAIAKETRDAGQPGTYRDAMLPVSRNIQMTAPTASATSAGSVPPPGFISVDDVRRVNQANRDAANARDTANASSSVGGLAYGTGAGSLDTLRQAGEDVGTGVSYAAGAARQALDAPSTAIANMIVGNGNPRLSAPVEAIDSFYKRFGINPAPVPDVRGVNSPVWRPAGGNAYMNAGPALQDRMADFIRRQRIAAQEADLKANTGNGPK